MTRYVPRPPVDDPWTGRSSFPHVIFNFSLNPPFKAKFWKYHYDEQPFWVGRPNQSIPLLDEKVGGGFPFKPPYWKYNNDDPGFWVGSKTRAQFQGNLNQLLTTSTEDLELPIDYFLMDNPLNIVSAVETPAGKLFRTRTSLKGYD